MLKLANQVIDAYDDVEREGLKKLAALGPSIHYMTPEERGALRDGDFALSLITKKASKLNKFAIDSHDNTWLSNHYFDMNCHKLPETAAKLAAANIKTACARHGIAPMPAVVIFAGMHKEAGAGNTFCEGADTKLAKANIVQVDLTKLANVHQMGENYTHAQYAMRTPAAVKIASKYFDDNHKEMQVEARHKYAAAIQRRAHELGMPAEKSMVGKYASDHYSGLVDAHVRARLSLLDESTNKEILSKIASMRSELSPTDFARALYGFDKKAGLSRYYGSHLTDPFQATFAAEPDQKPWRVKVGSASMGRDDLKMLANEKYAKIKDYFGSSVADEFRKDPQSIFESLPMDSKEVLAGIFNGTA
jgi:hypothetical protein